MARNTHLIHAIADALIEAHGQDATEWLDCGGRAAIERGVAGWRAAISEAAWIDRPEDVLVLRALRHIEHTMVLTGGEDIAARIRALVDEDWHGRRPGARARIGEVFAHDLLCGDTGEPFESIEYAWCEHGEAVRGEMLTLPGYAHLARDTVKASAARIRDSIERDLEVVEQWRAVVNDSRYGRAESDLRGASVAPQDYRWRLLSWRRRREPEDSVWTSYPH